MSDELKQAPITEEEVKQEIQETVNKLFPNEVTGMDSEERLMHMQELQTLGALMSATWHKPIYMGKKTKNPELQRSIALNIFSDQHLLLMKKRADEVMLKLQWTK